ncbi:hypothetical protein [Halomicrococcus sp. NG-SE-24]|uniref:hypothetical protein n=1 Tax=Halomicrococcus sp. NG-SE-24 TaxID=3436928 RepID=UPI003D9721CE
MGLLGDSSADFQAAQINEQHFQDASETPGTLLRITPYKQNEGIQSGARLLQAIHDVTTERKRLFSTKNVSDHHSFELWFDEGRVKFFMHAATDDAADKYTTRVENAYDNSDVHEVDDGDGFPPVGADDYVAAAELDIERHHFYPIRHHDGEGFEHDPYSEITSEMQSTEETRVVVQAVFRPEPKDWAEDDGSSMIGSGVSVDDVAQSLRDDEVEGWFDPYTTEASKKDKDAAKIVEQQRGKYAFNTNLRIIAISPDEYEAESRCEGVAGMFTRYYNSKTEQGFEANPVGEGRLSSVIESAQQREWTDHEMILTIDELAGAAHIPNDEINVANIDWKNTQRGSRVPADSLQSDKD